MQLCLFCQIQKGIRGKMFLGLASILSFLLRNDLQRVSYPQLGLHYHPLQHLGGVDHKLDSVCPTLQYCLQLTCSSHWTWLWSWYSTACSSDSTRLQSWCFTVSSCHRTWFQSWCSNTCSSRRIRLRSWCSTTCSFHRTWFQPWCTTVSASDRAWLQSWCPTTKC